MYIIGNINKHIGKKSMSLIESSSGFQRHIIPVAELKVINDINSRNPQAPQKLIKFDKDDMVSEYQQVIKFLIVQEK